MKYYNIEPVADAELGEDAVIDFTQTPRKIIALHAYAFGYPESDIIQAYPAFLVTDRLKKEIESAKLTGALFLPCKISKSSQYDELSNSVKIPEMWCMEPTGTLGDDIIFFSETRFIVSSRFLEIANLSTIGCIIKEIKDFPGS